MGVWMTSFNSIQAVYYITIEGSSDYFIANQITFENTDMATKFFSFHSIIDDLFVDIEMAKFLKQNDDFIVESDLGEIYHIQFLTKQIFDEKVKLNLLHPPVIELSSDEDVQSFLRSFNPYSIEPIFDALQLVKNKIAKYKEKEG